MNSEAIQEKSFLDCRVGNKFPPRNDANDNDKKRGSFRLPFTIYHLPHLAFTLAEVLITLTIIGVVAAATIPSLMQKTQDKEFKEAAKEAYSKASQAIEQMQQDKGEDLNGIYHSSSGFHSFHYDFMTYFKVIKDYGGYGVNFNYKNLLNTGIYGYNPMDYQFSTIDGMFWADDADPNETGNGISIAVDVNGYDKNPNVVGRDTFMFEVIGTSLLPMGAPNTDYPAPNYCKRTNGTWNENYQQGAGCMYYVMNGVDY